MTVTLTTLVSFDFPIGAAFAETLIANANGDLFGTTEYGDYYGGTVFEIVNTGTVAAPVYASTPITLVSFNGSNGYNPPSGLIADANGDLFGTTAARAAVRRRHSVRDREYWHRCRADLRQHPHHPGQLQRLQRSRRLH